MSWRGARSGFPGASSVDLLKNCLLWCRHFFLLMFRPGRISWQHESSMGKHWHNKFVNGLAIESAAVLAKTGVKPGLATILVGDDPASHLYVKSKQKACDAAGIYIDDYKLPASDDAGGVVGLN